MHNADWERVQDHIYEVFKKLDKSGDGFITPDEMKEAAKESGILKLEEELNAFMVRLGCNVHLAYSVTLTGNRAHEHNRWHEAREELTRANTIGRRYSRYHASACIAYASHERCAA